MKIQTDEKKASAELNCYKIELNNKPDLMAQTLNNDGSLVLVVDTVNGFCKSGALYSDRCAEIIPDVAAFLERVPQARKIFVRDCHSETAEEFKTFPPHCHNAEESAVVDELYPFFRESIDLPKNSTNGFYALSEAIPEISAYANIAVVGVCTDICVMQLCLSLKAYFNEIDAPANVIVFTDLVETYDSNLHGADLSNMFALKFMEQAGVQLFKNVK